MNYPMNFGTITGLEHIERWESGVAKVGKWTSKGGKMDLLRWESGLTKVGKWTSLP